jgi:hypothetical protein
VNRPLTIERKSFKLIKIPTMSSKPGHWARLKHRGRQLG